jgi:hypothetical protein
MYKLLPKLQTASGLQEPTCVQRLLDNAFIPFDPANTDYIEYLKFLAEGGQPLPADSE